MRVAVFGQSAFGAEVYRHLLDRGHEVVGVFTIPDAGGREDPLAAAAAANDHQVFKISKWKALKKDGGHVLPEALEQYKSVRADLNVLAFVTQFIPMEVSNACTHGSIIYHPSLLPRHRGASAINWTLMEGDKKTGLTVFWADEGLDTGPILLQKECDVEPNDTVNSIYKRYLFPEGVKALGEAVDLIASGKAPRIPQPEAGATYDPLWKDPKFAKIDFTKTAEQIHNFIRGNDRAPGAWGIINNESVGLFGSSLWEKSIPTGIELDVQGGSKPGIVTEEGLFLTCSDGIVKVSSVKVGGKFLPAQELATYFKSPVAA